MPFIPVENVALIECRMLYDSQKVENTLYCLNAGGWDTASLTEVATEVKDWWAASYSQLCSVEVSLREVIATDLTSETAGQAAVDGAGAVGAVGGGGMPSNVSLAVSFRTGLRGRSFRGRNYVVGIGGTFQEGINELDEDFIANVATQYNNLLTDVFTGDFVWVVVSRFSGVDPDTHKPIPRDAGVATPVVVALVVDNTIDSQRRRLPGRGQ